jgi:hypothetical protein
MYDGFKKNMPCPLLVIWFEQEKWELNLVKVSDYSESKKSRDF